MNQLDFKGRTAVVTGGMQGIGAAIVKRLEASGARVAVWDLDGPGKVDVSNSDSVQAAVNRTLQDLGKIDVLVNNAGVAGMNVPTVDYPIEEWERVLRINLTSQFLCCRAVAPHMVKAKYGRIVNIASVAGKEGNPNAVAYSASKGALLQFTKALAAEWAGKGVQVNAIAPGAFATDAQRVVLDSPELLARRTRKIPARRMGETDEIGPLVCYLASAKADFVTGSVFVIDGGESCRI